MAWKERGILEGFCIMEIKNKRIINGRDLCRVECEIGEKTFFNKLNKSDPLSQEIIDLYSKK